MKECSYRFVYSSTDHHYTQLDNDNNRLIDQIHPLFDPEYESIVQCFVSNPLVDYVKVCCAYCTIMFYIFISIMIIKIIMKNNLVTFGFS